MVIGPGIEVYWQAFPLLNHEAVVRDMGQTIMKQLSVMKISMPPLLSLSKEQMKKVFSVAVTNTNSDTLFPAKSYAANVATPFAEEFIPVLMENILLGSATLT